MTLDMRVIPPSWSSVTSWRLHIDHTSNMRNQSTTAFAVAAVATLALTACGQTTNAAAPVGAPAKASPQAISLETARSPFAALPELATLTASGEQSPVVLPTSAAAPFTFSHSPLTVTIANAASSQAQQADGLWLYPSAIGQSPEIVQPLKNGARFLTVLSTADQPATEYQIATGPVASTIAIKDDGSVNITDSAGIQIGALMAPWALDAQGKALPTHYEVSGASVRQVTDLSSAALPVTAGPALVAANADSPSAPYPTGSSAAPAQLQSNSPTQLGEFSPSGCVAKTNNPHNSGHAKGQTNVTSTIKCNVNVFSLWQTTSLWETRAWGWNEIMTGQPVNNANKNNIESQANYACHNTATYRGTAKSTSVEPKGHYNADTVGPNWDNAKCA